MGRTPLPSKGYWIRRVFYIFGGFFAIFYNFDLRAKLLSQKTFILMRWNFIKFFFGSDPPPPPGGYFKDFQLFFVILGFKWHKIGHKMKSLSQKSYPVASWNIIIKKNPRPPQWAPRSHSWLNLSNLFAFFEIFFAKITKNTAFLWNNILTLWLKIYFTVSDWWSNRSHAIFFHKTCFGRAYFIKKVPFPVSKMKLASLSRLVVG